ncbi:very short patch repair endonuclease [Brevibacillus borstelensis]|jgi:DNA mismatch endonuclease (patch repair protein)|uniref:Very short patch repair endonuclease n=1 Tax=Geobacillus stearothermophilus TaxID=1422 RepID=Q93L69_GEOSE|nr:very short patch repair endonuclease [Brevibacillus borstelensis]MBE5394942.1 very short patch repair endonuclease [Brevibacillus borstelensis]MED1743422.1 very short patch repair endonuclease [Brevibacillus borstelensis]WNF07568.1 very short patch repair endonuclease [Brevibacillus borstelensis]CAC50878.1 very short patch repair protein [Geobacillus stearothermophilus]
MADVLTEEQRRKNMQAIRSVSKLEEKIAKELWKRGIRFRRNVKDLLGKPDIAIKKYKVAVFIDSCFWHACEIHGRIPNTNTVFWVEKFRKNKKRDECVNNHYLDLGWSILRIWEHEVKADFNGVVDGIADFISSAKDSQS